MLVKKTEVYGISPEEFKKELLDDLRKEIGVITEVIKGFEPEEYLTRKEAAELLKVSVVTLSDWNKKGILNPYRLGNLVRYKRRELDEALIQINQDRNDRSRR